MTRRGFRRPDGEAGAYAILYGLLLLAICGCAAIVIDLGALREDRRQTRLASDAAAVAGARALDVGGAKSNPRQACTDAWSYLGTNLHFTVPGATGCSGLPASYLTCPSSGTAVSGSVGDYTVTITWPVTDGSTLLTQPNVNPATTTQAVDPAVDGTDPCARIAVSVAQQQRPAFASVFGTGTVTTSVTSVARSATTPGGDGPIAALNVLEQHDCDSVLTSGQGYIQVRTTVDDKGKILPGIIAVESSGITSNNSCNGSTTYVINPAKTSSGAYIRADGFVDGDGLGVIESYALNPTLGNPAKAFDPSLAPPGGVLLRPAPTVMGERFGDTPVRAIYDASPSYISALKAAYDASPGAPTTGYAGSPIPYDTQAFDTLPDTTKYPQFPNNCKIGPGAAVLMPAHNYFINCALSVQGTLVFAGGNIVAKSTVDATGCLAVNVPETGSATCPTLNAGKTDVATVPTTESVLYIRSGDLTKGSNGSLFLARTFTYLAGSGSIGITGGGSGILLWTNPMPDSTCVDACANARFGKLSFWTESATGQNLGGQTDMVLRGVLFMPKAVFTYTGATSINQTAAQFWTLKIVVKGQSGLTMAPDPTNTIPRPELGTVLIR